MVGVKRTCQLQNPENPALPLGVYCYKNLKFFLFNRLLPEKTILLVPRLESTITCTDLKSMGRGIMGRFLMIFCPYWDTIRIKLIYLTRNQVKKAPRTATLIRTNRLIPKGGGNSKFGPPA